MIKTSLDIDDLKTVAGLLLVIWLGLLFVILLREVVGNLTIRNWNYDAVGALVTTTVRMWLPWVFMSPCAVILIKKFPLNSERWKKNLGLHLLFVSAFTFIHLAAAAFLFEAFSEQSNMGSMRAYAGWEHMGHFLVGDPFFLTDIIIYGLFVTSFNISTYIELVRQKEQVANKLEAYLTEAKLQALQMQVNPHFLFNTLNSISVLIQKNDTAAAGEMIHRLSDFFRMTLEKSASQLVPLESELELLDNYLAIEQERFRDRLHIEKFVDSRTLTVNVPVMLLQPLVENSLRHGIGAMEGPGKIEISSHFLADRILLEIGDNGPGNSDFYGPQFKEGIGLSNVRARLEQLYGDDFVFSIHSSPGNGVKVSIEIPVDTASYPAERPKQYSADDLVVALKLDPEKA